MTLSASNIIHSKKTSWSQGGLGSMNYFPKTRCTLSVLKASSDITAAGSRTFCKFLGWSVGVKAGEQRVRLGVTLGRSPPFDGAGVGGCDSEQLPRMVKECSSFQTCKALVNLVLQYPSEARTESGSLRTPAHKLKFANEPPREILTIMSTSSKNPRNTLHVGNFKMFFSESIAKTSNCGFASWNCSPGRDCGPASADLSHHS